MTDYEPTDTPKLRPIMRKKKNSCVVGESPELPENITKILYRGMTKFTPAPYKYAPIVNIDSYVRDMKLTGEAEEQCRARYTPEPENISEPKFKLEVPSDPLHVFVNFNILKSGIVRVKITAPMEPVYEYQRRGKMAPLDVRLKAYKGFGYPESYLIKMIEHHDKMKAISKELDEFINLIFAKCINAKVSKPKAKTVQESLNSKLKKPTAKKY